MDQGSLIKSISLSFSSATQMAGLRGMQLPRDRQAGPQERSPR